MGINAHYADNPTDFEWEITRRREEKENQLREQVKTGAMKLDYYITHVKGFDPQYLPALRPQFKKAIFGS